MSFLNTGFDATKVEPNNGYVPLPDGRYLCLVEKVAEVPTKNGKGTMVVAELVVVDGKHKGRKLTHRMNVIAENPTAQSIGRGQLSALCHAVNVLQPKSYFELANKTIYVTVKVVASNLNAGQMDNKIAKIESAAPSAPVQPSAPVAEAEPAPWAP